MPEIEDSTLERVYKPYDIVSDIEGNVGFIQEVSINKCQEGFDDQVSYAVNWLKGRGVKHAWYRHEELDRHCNLFVKIAEVSCHPYGAGSQSVKLLFSNMREK